MIELLCVLVCLLGVLKTIGELGGALVSDEGKPIISVLGGLALIIIPAIVLLLQ